MTVWVPRRLQGSAAHVNVFLFLDMEAHVKTEVLSSRCKSDIAARRQGSMASRRHPANVPRAGASA
jgi:hypothetical protein